VTLAIALFGQPTTGGTVDDPVVYQAKRLTQQWIKRQRLLPQRQMIAHRLFGLSRHLVKITL
jgi:hypothetical protein